MNVLLKICAPMDGILLNIVQFPEFSSVILLARLFWSSSFFSWHLILFTVRILISA